MNILNSEWVEQGEVRTSKEIEGWMYKDKENYPDNYVQDVLQNIGKYKYLFIATEPSQLKLLHDKGVEICLIYPENELREEYLQRYIDRDSPYDFIGVFMKHWDEWLDELKDQRYKQIILNSGEYLKDGIDKIK